MKNPIRRTGPLDRSNIMVRIPLNCKINKRLKYHAQLRSDDFMEDIQFLFKTQYDPYTKKEKLTAKEVNSKTNTSTNLLC